jgi:hypothetical protein
VDIKAFRTRSNQGSRTVAARSCGEGARDAPVEAEAHRPLTVMATNTTNLVAHALIEEADAWFEYLETTKGIPEPSYSEVESWAWSRLQTRLRIIRRQRVSA